MKLTEKQKSQILLLNAQDISWRGIAKELNIPRSTVSDFLSKRTYKDWWNGMPEVVTREQPKVFTPVKILIYDVENSPEVSYAWGRWKQNIGEPQVIRRPYMLTWAAKWLGENEVITDKLTNYPDFKEDIHNDYNIVKSLWELINEADIIIAHNGDRHDEPLLMTRAMIHGLQPPSPYKRIDTLKEIKKVFKFPSNALKSLLNHLDLTRKIENEGFNLWRRCMEGDYEAFEVMEDYNIGDTVSLEELYLLIRPWIRNHPNVSLYGDNTRRSCVACGSEDLEYMAGQPAYTGVSVFLTHRCNSCGKVNRERTNIKNAAERKKVLTNAL